MTISAAFDAARTEQQMPQVPVKPTVKADAPDAELREAFDNFVGQTFYAQMLASMRRTVGKPAYFYGGRAEEIFQQQLDQTLAEQMSKASSHSFTGPMYELFTLRRP